LLCHCLNLSFFLFIQRGFGRQCAWMDWLNFIRSACFVARLIEKIKPIISVGSDRFNFEWIKRYERICSKGYMLLDTVPDFNWTIRQSVLRIGLICRWIGRGDCCRHLPTIRSIPPWLNHEMWTDSVLNSGRRYWIHQVAFIELNASFICLLICVNYR
jgi:hypothetical protein